MLLKSLTPIIAAPIAAVLLLAAPLSSQAANEDRGIYRWSERDHVHNRCREQDRDGRFGRFGFGRGIFRDDRECDRARLDRRHGEWRGRHGDRFDDRFDDRFGDRFDRRHDRWHEGRGDRRDHWAARRDRHGDWWEDKWRDHWERWDNRASQRRIGHPHGHEHHPHRH